MKQCSKCRQIKADDQFNFRNKKRGLKQPYCKECQRVISNEWYYNNKDQHLINVKRNKKKHVARALEFKASLDLKCENCGEDHSATLDFHHEDPSQKELLVSDMWHAGFSLERIKKELSKCKVLCANCHRIHHWEERNGPLGE